MAIDSEKCLKRITETAQPRKPFFDLELSS